MTTFNDDFEGYVQLVEQMVEGNLSRTRDIYDSVKGKTHCHAALLITDIYNRYTETYYLFAKRSMFKKAEDIDSAEKTLTEIKSVLREADKSFRELKELGCFNKDSYSLEIPLIKPQNQITISPFSVCGFSF